MDTPVEITPLNDNLQTLANSLSDQILKLVDCNAARNLAFPQIENDKSLYTKILTAAMAKDKTTVSYWLMHTKKDEDSESFIRNHFKQFWETWAVLLKNESHIKLTIIRALEHDLLDTLNLLFSETIFKLIKDNVDYKPALIKLIKKGYTSLLTVMLKEKPLDQGGEHFMLGLAAVEGRHEAAYVIASRKGIEHPLYAESIRYLEQSMAKQEDPLDKELFKTCLRYLRTQLYFPQYSLFANIALDNNPQFRDILVHIVNKL